MRKIWTKLGRSLLRSLKRLLFSGTGVFLFLCLSTSCKSRQLNDGALQARGRAAFEAPESPFQRPTDAQLREAVKKYQECAGSRNKALMGLPASVLDVLIFSDSEAAQAKDPDLWTHQVKACRIDHNGFEFHANTVRLSESEIYNTFYAQGFRKKFRDLMCWFDRRNANHGRVHWNHKIFGDGLATYLGFFAVSEKIYVAPSAELLIFRIKSLNDLLESKGFEPIPLEFYVPQKELKVDGGTYLQDFVFKHKLPIATSGYLLQHDRNFHISILLMSPSWFAEIRKTLRVHLEFASIMEELGSEGTSLSRRLKGQLARSLDKLGGLASRLYNNIYSEQEQAETNPSASHPSNKIFWERTAKYFFEFLNKLGSPESIRKDFSLKARPTEYLNFVRTGPERKWYERNFAELWSTFEQRHGELLRPLPHGPADSADFAALAHERWMELNQVTKSALGTGAWPQAFERSAIPSECNGEP